MRPIALWRPMPPAPATTGVGWHWVRGRPGIGGQQIHEALAGQLQAGDRLGLVETLETLGGLLDR